MTDTWNIAGHKKQLEFLSAVVASGRLAQVYIFSGPKGVGKKTVAKKLVQFLLCEKNQACNQCGQCKSLVVQSNADFIDVSSDEAIKIEQVRELIYKLSLKPYLATHKIALIDDAERLTVEAGNALLKQLEEPKPNTHLVLITSVPDRLLKTISSRAQKINFGLVDRADYDSLIPQSLSLAQKDLITTLAAGRPGLINRILKDEEYLSKLNEINSQYEKFISKDLADKLILGSTLAELEPADLKEVLYFWILKLEQALRMEPGIPFANKIKNLTYSVKLLDQNVNTKLLLSNLMLA
ncbi:MAG TPA: DNA polymerase III subunit [Patescibacteria group bacterium]|jgi:DNA polymerase-3 subunit delta'|nr:DNA polymerase III subunit [Patescibacteria group bacterium]